METCQAIGVTVAGKLYADALAHGARVGEWDQAQAAAIPRRVARAITAYIAEDAAERLIPASWSLLAVEHAFPDYGYARPDLVVHDGLGPAIVDLKTRLTLDPRWRERELMRYRHSWQLLHYAWAWGQYAQCRVGRYYICLVVLEPRFSVELMPYPITSEALAVWEQSAQRVWAQMAAEDQGAARPWMAAKHADEFGNCEFYDACFTHQWDEARMAVDYMRR